MIVEPTHHTIHVEITRVKINKFIAKDRSIIPKFEGWKYRIGDVQMAIEVVCRTKKQVLARILEEMKDLEDYEK